MYVFLHLLYDVITRIPAVTMALLGLLPAPMPRIECGCNIRIEEGKAPKSDGLVGVTELVVFDGGTIDGPKVRDPVYCDHP